MNTSATKETLQQLPGNAAKTQHHGSSVFSVQTQDRSGVLSWEWPKASAISIQEAQGKNDAVARGSMQREEAFHAPAGDDAPSQPGGEDSSFSLHQIDEVVKAQGKDLMELLPLFRNSTAEPPSSFLLQTPKHKGGVNSELLHSLASRSEQLQSNISQQVNNPGSLVKRQSPRLKAKSEKIKPVIKLAQELVAKKWGILEEEKEMDNMTLQQYIDMYKQPLNEDALDAIQALTKVADDVNSKKKKKKDKKNKKEGADCTATNCKGVKDPSMLTSKNSSVLVEGAEA
jgi:hypothetical protein